MNDIERVERLMEIFKGSTKAHGVYVEVKDDNPLIEKKKGEAMTVSKPPTLTIWKQHYEGERGIGIVPINENNCCNWAALDLDKKEFPNINHTEILKNIKAHKLPLLVTKTKSNDAHIYIMFKEPQTAKSVRIIMAEIASILGYAGCEIFPKQDVLKAEKGELGNWLNMPYYGDTRKGVTLVKGFAEELDIDDFLDLAEETMLTNDTYDELIKSLKMSVKAREEILEGAPPCLTKMLAQHGIEDGRRNAVVFNLGVYCKKRYKENWEDKLRELHDKFCEDPLSHSNLKTIIKSVESGDFFYQCSNELINKYCNKQSCAKQAFGIDVSSDVKGLKSAVRITFPDPLYIIDLELPDAPSTQVYVDTDTLFNQENFRKECAVQLQKVFEPVNAKKWNEIVKGIVDNALNQDPPEEMCFELQVYRELQHYLSLQMRDDKEVLNQREGAWRDLENYKVYFKLENFRQHLMTQSVIKKTDNLWKLGNFLADLNVPTEEYEVTDGKRTTRHVDIFNERIRIGGMRMSLKAISVDEVPDAAVKPRQTKEEI